ncbi:MAG: glycoside hydrolase family 95 protein, partial [Candidatus Brocadiia bacterium]
MRWFGALISLEKESSVMKQGKMVLLSAYTVFFLLCSVTSYAELKGETASREHRMIYSTPFSKHDPATPAAEQWDQALPTGNGRIGALVFGNISNETIILNHDSLFFRTKKPVLPDVSEHLPKIRKLMNEGQYEQAGRYFKDQGKIDYSYHGSDSFHPAFNLTLDMPTQTDAKEIYRAVDFETGEVIVSWKSDDVTYNRKLFVSRKDNLVVMSFKASRPQSVNCSIGLLPTALKRDELGDGNDVRVPRFPTGRVAKIRLDEVPVTFNLKAKDNYLTIRADYDKGGKYNLIGGPYGGCARIVVSGGQTRTSKLQIFPEKADEVLILARLFANEDADVAMERELKALQGIN